ncbi:MAG: hypothetical protein JSS20_22375 [Proteobacteria bacterium]|nr:hypothetical protein [Pseudomonadota bacterium]
MRIILGGLLVLAAGAIYNVVFVNIPYQDPTPELQARWLFDEAVSRWIMGVGIAGIVVGAVQLAWRRMRSR